VKTLLATTVGATGLLATGAAYAANAQMVNAGRGAEASAWMPLLFAIVVFGLVTWVLSQLASERMEGREEQGKPKHQPK
jgi:hypothetical protein